MSCVSSSSEAPSAAVRTMTPASSGQAVLEDPLEAVAFDVGQLAGDAGHGTAGHVHEVAAGQRDLAGEAGALVADRVLGDLDQHGVAGLQRVLDPALLAFEVDGLPVHFTGVEHGVAAAADVHEGGFHGGQHVLDLAQVDVADQGVLLGLGDEVLGQDAVLEDADLDSVVALADDHLAVHGFAAGQELGLGDDGAAAAGVAGFAAALLLGFQAGGALDGGDAVVDRRLGHGPRRADAGHRVGRIVAFPAGQFQVLVAAAAAAAAARGHAVFEVPSEPSSPSSFGAFRLGVGLGGRCGCARAGRGCGADGGCRRPRPRRLLRPRAPLLRRQRGPDAPQCSGRGPGR